MQGLWGIPIVVPTYTAPPEMLLASAIKFGSAPWEVAIQCKVSPF